MKSSCIWTKNRFFFQIQASPFTGNVLLSFNLLDGNSPLIFCTLYIFLPTHWCSWDWLGLVGFMVFNTTFNNIHLYRGNQFYWWRKLEFQEKTTYLRQVTDKLYHIMLYTSPERDSKAHEKYTIFACMKNRYSLENNFK